MFSLKLYKITGLEFSGDPSWRRDRARGAKREKLSREEQREASRINDNNRWLVVDISRRMTVTRYPRAAAKSFVRRENV